MEAGPRMLIVAADLSLSNTGLAAARLWPSTPQSQPPKVTVWSVSAPAKARVNGDEVPVPMPARHGRIVGAVFGPLDAHPGSARLVVKEQRLAAAGNRQPGSAQSAQDIAGLHAVLEYGLWRRGIPCVSVPGPTLKKYATGRHQAAKEDVRVAASKRLEHLAECRNNDESDALWLLVMAASKYGFDLGVTLPVVQMLAADKVEWTDGRPARVGAG